jgi:VWFA-related protein
MTLTPVLRLALGAIAAVVVSGHSVAGQPTFSSRVEVVRLDVLVTDDGRPVRGLTASDFEVRDNGVLQTVEHVDLEQLPLGVVLTVDASASVIGERLEHLRDAGGAVLDALNSRDEAALITFSHTLTQQSGLTRSIADVREALAAIDPNGDTALIDGAYAGITVADGAAGRGLLIVFSDGSETASWLTADAVIDAARRSEVVVYGVASGARKPAFLRELANITGGRLYEVESTRNLRSVFLSALEEFRQRYLLSYTPSGVTKGGWHRLDVKVKGRRATIKARPGYLAGS